MLVCSACFKVTYATAPEPEVPIPGWDAGKYQVQKFTAALTDRDRALYSMQTPAIMEYTAPGQHLKAKEDIVVRRPNSLRVEARSPLGVALLIAAQGDQLAIFEPGKNRFSRGHATAETLYKYVRIPMAPADAIALLMGLAPRAVVPGVNPDAVSNEGAMTIATYGDRASGTRQLGFADGQHVMVRETEADGGVRYEALLLGGADHSHRRGLSNGAESRQFSISAADCEWRCPGVDVRADPRSWSHSDEPEPGGFRFASGMKTKNP
jgi:hypothetical protein